MNIPMSLTHSVIYLVDPPLNDEDAGAGEVAVGVDADVERVVLSLGERRCGWVTRAKAGKRVVVQS